MFADLDVQAQKLRGKYFEPGRAATCKLSVWRMTGGISDVFLRVTDKKSFEVVTDCVTYQDSILQNCAHVFLDLLQTACM